MIKNQNEKMKKYAIFSLLIITSVLGLAIFRSDVWQAAGFTFFSGVLIWNIYAYAFGMGMLRPPKMNADVSAGSDKSTRVFLFVVSLLGYLLLNVGLAWKYFQDSI